MIPVRRRLRRVEGVPVVSIRGWIPGGQRLEEIPGLSWCAGRLLVEGTRSRSWERIAGDAESRGASVRGVAGAEVHGVAIDGLASDVDRLLDWTRELLLESVFPKDRLDWVVHQGRGELAAMYDPPDSATMLAFQEQLYAPHPRSRPAPGSDEGLDRLDPEAVESFHRGGLERGPLVAVAGRIDVGEVSARLEQLFGPVPDDGAVSPPPVPAEPAGLQELRREVPVDGQGQAHLLLGQLTVPRWHPDMEALELAGVVLGAGAGLHGRIPERVREREGLAYVASAATVVDAGTEAGRSTFYVATSVETVDRAERAIRDELDRALGDGFTDEEVREARTYLLGREPFRRETARQWAGRLAEALYWRRPVDDPSWRQRRLSEPTRHDVEAALRRWLRTEELRVTIGR